MNDRDEIHESAPDSPDKTPSSYASLVTAMRILVRLAVLACAGLALAGFLEGQGWAFMILASFRYGYVPILALGVLILAWPRPRRPRIAAVVGLALVSQVVVIGPYLGLGRPGDAPGDAYAEDAGDLLVLQLNTWIGNERVGRIVRLIEAESPDLVAFQEIDPLRLARIAEPLEDRYRVIAATRNAALVRTDRPDLRLEESQYVDLGNREAIALRFRLDDTPIAAFCWHATIPIIPEMMEARDEQFRQVAAWARRTGPEVEQRLVVMGDLNAVPWCRALRRMLRDGNLGDPGRRFTAWPTWPTTGSTVADLLFLPIAVPIDHVLHGAGLVATSRRIGPPVGSDHRPVLVHLRVRDQPSDQQ